MRICKYCKSYYIPSTSTKAYCDTMYDENGNIKKYDDADIEDALSCKEYHSLIKSEEIARKNNKEKKDPKRLYKRIKNRLKTRAQRDNDYLDNFNNFEMNYNYNDIEKKFIIKFQGDMDNVELELLKVYEEVDKQSREYTKYKTKPYIDI